MMDKYNHSPAKKNSNNKYVNNVIIDALRYHDTNMEKYESFYKKIHSVDFKYTTSDLEHNKIIFYDKKGNVLLESRYEMIGVYDTMGRAWTWAWATPRVTKNKIQLIKRVLNYGIDLDPQQIFLKTELITSRFKISNDIQLDIHTALASYLSKQPLIYKNIVSEPTDRGPDTLRIFEYIFLLDFNALEKNNIELD